jgi:hypothetical protein
MAQRSSCKAFFSRRGGAILAVWTLLGVYVYLVRAQE